ncbi:hypothetical protein LVD15_07310 [Fulvivirga maritima]|uniref:hypothetical protein n=1 Tax=Fulvivirga maritima TaxID=2904247 RepID=UPI001F194CA6|nr:hypothetical protein [Fulvivirga maritima]UII28225.1 hypothetical protein LVD15_07310 [Fulvivirga maritima]
MVKKIILGILTVALVGTFIFFKLGGGETLDFQEKDYPHLYISGKEYVAKYNDPKMEKLFFQAKKIAEQRGDCNLTVVNYLTPVMKDSVRQFIGVTSTDSTIISGMAFNDVRTFHNARFLSTVITAHNLVMPRPEDVREEANNYAEKQGYKLDEYTIEVYKDSRDMEIYFPIITE